MKKIEHLSVGLIKTSGAQPNRLLQTSIIEIGQQEEIRVRKLSDNEYEEYEIIDGRNRFETLVSQGAETVECIVETDVSDEDFHLKALVANASFGNKWDEANHIETLLNEFNWTQQQVCKELGYSQATVSQRLKLVERLSDRVKNALDHKDIRVSHALSLTDLPEKDQDRIIKELDNGKIKASEIPNRVKDWKSEQMESLFDTFVPVEIEKEDFVLDASTFKEALVDTIEVKFKGKTYLVDIREI